MNSDGRVGNLEAAKRAVQPQGTKSTATEVKEHIEGAVDTISANVLPNNEKARDNLPGGANHHDHTLAAFKPEGEQSTGDKLKAEKDKVQANVTPESQKSLGTQAEDTIKPGHKSSVTQGDGIIAGTVQAAKDAKNAVVDALSTKKEDPPAGPRV